jgi:solute carrier family 34 (sodium-dependent phosphate cotransporter)
VSASTHEERLPLVKSTSLVDNIDNSPLPLRSLAPKVALHAAAVVAALWLFVIALQLIKSGAGGLRPVLDSVSADGIAGHFGFGWFGAYVVMSGSPVAAVAMSLFAGGAITDLETFAMINGTRMGASLIVLVVGFVSYVTGKRNPDGLYIGVVALLTAITLWGPAMPLGLLVLDKGWLDGIRISSPGGLTSFVGTISDPVVNPVADALPRLGMFVAGVLCLVTAFTVFDRGLPSLERPGPRIEAMSKLLQQRYAMFAFGTLMTMVTLSVSLSVTILVPLALKGYVRRDRVIPYVMGANIATWVDTLFAALLLDSPRAFTIVLTEMLVGGSVSLFVLFFAYGPYTRFILAIAHRVSSTRRNLVIFLGCLILTPLFFLAI